MGRRNELEHGAFVELPEVVQATADVQAQRSGHSVRTYPHEGGAAYTLVDPSSVASATMLSPMAADDFGYGPPQPADWGEGLKGVEALQRNDGGTGAVGDYPDPSAIGWVDEYPVSGRYPRDVGEEIYRSGGRPPIAKDPKTPKEKGKKGAHVRKSKYAKGSTN